MDFIWMWETWKDKCNWGQTGLVKALVSLRVLFRSFTSIRSDRVTGQVWKLAGSELPFSSSLSSSFTQLLPSFLCVQHNQVQHSLNLCPRPHFYDSKLEPFKKSQLFMRLYVTRGRAVPCAALCLLVVWIFARLRFNEVRWHWIFWIISSIKMKLTPPVIWSLPISALYGSCQHLESQGRPLIKTS